eukprot:165075_1
MANIPFKSKRAMTTAALFTDIFRKYLDRNKCENISSSNSEELDQFSSEILDHVIILGGFCRDVLLNRAINDIDIMINLRELCKLQTNHLKKYHSKKEDQDRNVRCVYWQRYLERFNDESGANEAQSTNKEMIMMHNLNYIFNCSFWLNILKMDDLLDNKLSIKDVPAHGFVSAQIVNTVKYGNINLDQQSIDFIDTFSIDQCVGDSFVSNYPRFNTFHRKSRQLSMSGIAIDRKDLEDVDETTSNSFAAEQKGNKSRPEHDENDHSHKHDHAAHQGQRQGRLKSMAVIEFDIDDLGGDFGNFGNFKAKDAQQTLSRPEYITIEVPIYSGKVRYKLLNYDFSINTSIIPLSNIIKLKEYNNAYNAEHDAADTDAPMTWIEIIENGLGECDAIQDTQVNKILRCPESNHETCTIQAHPMTFVFWRIVSWMVRDPSFKLDKNLIVAQIRDYDRWATPEWFGKAKNCTRFLNHFVRTLKNECHSLRDVRQMLETMKMLQFNAILIGIVNEKESVRHSLVDCISGACDENDAISAAQVTDVFQEYSYPIQEQLFRISSQTEQELDKVQARRTFLESEVVNKNERIQDLEQQNDRLLKEVRYLQQLNQQKDNNRITELEQQNSRLLHELHAINDSKVQLAHNANKTIDELRQYLIQYQQAMRHQIKQ